MKLTKKQQTWKNLDTDKVYALADAIEVLREYASKKFDETLEIAIRLGIDVTKADQNIRGMLSLPNGTGKTVRVAVFTANAQDEAKKAGADVVGGEELIDSVAAGNINFDRVFKKAKNYAEKMIDGVLFYLKEIDGVLESFSEKWDIFHFCR